MSKRSSMIEKILCLTSEQKREVMEFVESLKKSPRRARRSLMGMFSDLNLHITEEDIAEARREMWAAFLDNSIGELSFQQKNIAFNEPTLICSTLR